MGHTLEWPGKGIARFDMKCLDLANSTGLAIRQWLLLSIQSFARHISWNLKDGFAQ